MELTILGSSSQGNCYVIQNATEALVLEAGIDFQEVQRALDWDVSKVVGCLISHEHMDHAARTHEFLQARIPVFASAGTISKIQRVKSFTPLLFTIKASEPFTAGRFQIIPFETKHDSEEPLGFYINHPETGNILFATDTYYLPCKFAGLNNVLIECNYRLDILEDNIAAGRIPSIVRNRTIKSHFSYKHCLEALQANDISAVNNIVLIHLSDGNSDAEAFRKGIKEATGKNVLIAEPGLQINFNKTPF